MFEELHKHAPYRLPIAPLSIHTAPRQLPIRRPDEFFSDHQVIWVIEGEGVFTFDGRTEHLGVGQGMLMRRGTAYAYHAAHGGTFSTRWVAFCGGDAVLTHYGVGDFLVFDTPAFLDGATDRLEQACRTGRGGMRSAHMLLWLCELLETLTGEEEPLVKRVEHYLEGHLDRPLSLDELSAALGIDKYRLCHAYKQATGETVMGALRQLRMRRAQRLLLTGVHTVGEISTLCGYDSPSYFIKHFKEATGLTPRAFRERKG